MNQKYYRDWSRQISAESRENSAQTCIDKQNIVLRILWQYFNNILTIFWQYFDKIITPRVELFCIAMQKQFYSGSDYFEKNFTIQKQNKKNSTLGTPLNALTNNY